MHQRVHDAYWEALNEAADPETAEQQLRRLVGELERDYPSAAACLAEDLPALCVHLKYFPRIRKRYGKLDVLVNNAGITIRRSIEATTEEDWDRIMGINAKGVFLGTKHAIPAMRQSGGGSIINISSIAGKVGVPFTGEPATLWLGPCR